jgi:3',5'-cyclic AMP phosphodiesterase CpdA
MLLAQLSDLHLRPPGQGAYRVVETNMLAERALRAIARFRPRLDALVISGDLAFDGASAEYQALAAMLARYIHIPVYVIPGNHDRRALMKTVLGHLPGVADDQDFIHYVVDRLPVRLVMLDTLVPGRSHGELCPLRLEFLRHALAAAPDKPTLIVMHHPPFLCGIEHMDGIMLREPEAFTEIVAANPQVQAVLCGHHHRMIVSRLGSAIVEIAPSVAHQVELALVPGTAGAFIMEPAAFLVHRWDGSTLVSHLAYVEDFEGPYPFVVEQE